MPVDDRVWWSAGALSLLGVLAFARRTRDYRRIDPELRSVFSRFRTPAIGRTLVPLLKSASRKPTAVTDGVSMERREIAGPAGALDVYVYRPADVRPAGPAMLYTHGGGMVIGSAPGYHEIVSRYARALGMIVVSADYRLAPEHPFPAPLDDVVAAYRWLTGPNDLDIDPTSVVVAGESAGGGLTASLCQRLRDDGDRSPIFQLLIYPMLDDRTVIDPPRDASGQILWTRGSNAYGWTSFLGHRPGAAAPARYAVPARCDDLRGLPPAWIGVGDLDLFHDEDVRYAQRLRQSGVPCRLTVVSGAFHGFDARYSASTVARAFKREQVEAVRTALAGGHVTTDPSAPIGSGRSGSTA